MKKISSPKLVQTSCGFWRYDPSPSPEELSNYYANKYYQQAKGSYELSYSEEEKRYFELKASLMFKQVMRLNKAGRISSVLDIGCGEGWYLDKFYREGMTVRGIDFSSHGIEKFHPHLKMFFTQGNIYELLVQDIQQGCHYDVVILANVIEHVVDPEELLEEIRKVLSENGILIIVAPNDFSRLHQFLLGGNFIDRPFWLTYPDHLSYFNKESMQALLGEKGFCVKAIVADNPIDLNLFNDNSNYIKDKKKGKKTHLFRVRVDNFLGGLSEEKLLDLYAIYGQMGVGRDLNYFCRIK